MVAITEQLFVWALLELHTILQRKDAGKTEGGLQKSYSCGLKTANLPVTERLL